MKNKSVNFQIPEALQPLLVKVQSRTGLSYAELITWGLTKCKGNSLESKDVVFSVATPGRLQFLVKLPTPMHEILQALRAKTQRPLWEILDIVLYYCNKFPPPNSLETTANPIFAKIDDDLLVRELFHRGYRVITRENYSTKKQRKTRGPGVSYAVY